MGEADKNLLIGMLVTILILLGYDLSKQTRFKMEYKKQLIELQIKCSRRNK